jgi:hypothetical protein
MKKITLILAAVLILVIGLYIRCTKVNTDQPCGTYQNSQQLFKDGDNKCYYVDQSTHKNVYVDQSLCSCY